jgi:hypothetical protein
VSARGLADRARKFRGAGKDALQEIENLVRLHNAACHDWKNAALTGQEHRDSRSRRRDKLQQRPRPCSCQTFDRRQRIGGTYLEDCPMERSQRRRPFDWNSHLRESFFISRPVFSGMHASADIEKSISPNQRIDGKRIAPFIEMESCTLEKRGGRWQLIECKMKFIT